MTRNTNTQKFVGCLMLLGLATGLGLFALMWLKLPHAQSSILTITGVISLAPTFFVARMAIDLWRGNYFAVARKLFITFLASGILSLGLTFIPQIVEGTGFLKEPANSVTTWVQNAWNGVQNVQQGIGGIDTPKAGEVTYVYVLFKQLGPGCTVTVKSNVINIRKTPNAESDSNIDQKDVVKGTPLTVVAESFVQNGEISWFMLPDQKTFVRSDVVSKPVCSSV